MASQLASKIFTKDNFKDFNPVSLAQLGKFSASTEPSAPSEPSAPREPLRDYFDPLCYCFWSPRRYSWVDFFMPPRVIVYSAPQPAVSSSQERQAEERSNLALLLYLLVLIPLSVAAAVYAIGKIKKALQNITLGRKQVVSTLRLGAFIFSSILGYLIGAQEGLAFANTALGMLSAPIFGVLGAFIVGTLGILLAKYLAQGVSWFYNGYTNTGVDSLPYAAHERAMHNGLGAALERIGLKRAVLKKACPNSPLYQDIKEGYNVGDVSNGVFVEYYRHKYQGLRMSWDGRVGQRQRDEIFILKKIVPSLEHEYNYGPGEPEPQVEGRPSV